LKKYNRDSVKITVLDGYTLNPGDLSWAELEKFGEIKIYDRTEAALTVERSIDADILVVNKHLIDEHILQKLPKLKCICVSATGFNNVDIKSASKRNIPVCNVSGYGSSSVAQQVFALILELLNHVGKYNESVKKGEWSNAQDFTYYLSPIIGLEGKTLGIYGFGKIGQKVANIALSFDMKVIATHKHPERDAKPGVQFVSLENLFSESDIVTLHTPLNPDNEHFVNENLLRKMKPTAFLINTGRGRLINETDLKMALENKWLAGAGLDVLQNEPPPLNHPLFGVDNCIITPHLAWANIDARSRLLQLTAKNVEAFLQGNPINVVNEIKKSS